MLSVQRFDCFPLSKGDDTFWFGSKTVDAYLLGGAIDVKSVDVVVRRELVDENKEKDWYATRRMRNGHVEVYGYAFWVNQCTSGFHGVNEPGGVRVAREDDRGVTEGREDVREVFQQRGSGAKRKLSRCGRNQMGNEPILALPEGADDFVVYYDARSKDLEACLEKKGEGDCLYVATTEEGLNMRQRRWMKLFSEYGFKAKYHLGKANVVVESWSRKKSEAKNKVLFVY
ncbi:hypothetical protein Tco_0428367 [Tanacetum coccineum]